MRMVSYTFLTVVKTHLVPINTVTKTETVRMNDADFFLLMVLSSFGLHFLVVGCW